MGGSSSTRRVVVEDAGEEDIVTISEAVVRRLKGQPDVEQKGSDRPSPPVSPPPPRTYEKPDYASTLLRNKEVEDFYLLKLKELQERNAALQKVTNEQFAVAVKEVEEKFVKATASPVCQELQAKVLECYRANPGAILNCSAIVTAFTTCVDKARMSTLLSDYFFTHMPKLAGAGMNNFDYLRLLHQHECME